MADQALILLAADTVRLRHNTHGDVIATIAGEDHLIGQIQSVFPISNRHHFALLRDELERSYFLPRITDIQAVDERHGVFTMDVITDRGPRTFEVRNPRQNVRPVGDGRYIIKDVDGNRYDIPKLGNLGPRSQNLMTEFV